MSYSKRNDVKIILLKFLSRNQVQIHSLEIMVNITLVHINDIITSIVIIICKILYLMVSHFRSVFRFFFGDM